ncbi:DUF2922 domain-containing protein [Enterococcus raffinosus]|uniref:DUF2922 domain-containing protein n=1 Tax=Enterococcus TaxID=1350 RepID=UPI001C45125B|nr:DUF2922 domain-containing protein [Enterococcus raffinosus]MDT2572793.1 DUF2922 domain-containing protein [Enterococcus raffinosus]QXJ58007.1 DUF2922 domain-containing protein [Enterococcus raffinosus]
MYTLDAEFENTNGKSQHLRLKGFDPSKTAEEIRASLEKLTKLSLFEKDGIGLFDKVLHAKMIEKRETPIFDQKDLEVSKTADAKIQQTEALPQVSEIEQKLADICIPEDLVITEAKPQADVLVQAIEFPRGVDPRELTESQALVIISACIPAGAALEDIRIDDSTNPPQLVLVERITEEKANEELFQKPSERPKKRRKRLLDRIRKRE